MADEIRQWLETPLEVFKTQAYAPSELLRVLGEISQAMRVRQQRIEASKAGSMIRQRATVELEALRLRRLCLTDRRADLERAYRQRGAVIVSAARAARRSLVEQARALLDVGDVAGALRVVLDLVTPQESGSELKAMARAEGDTYGEVWTENDGGV